MTISQAQTDHDVPLERRIERIEAALFRLQEEVRELKQEQRGT